MDTKEYSISNVFSACSGVVMYIEADVFVAPLRSTGNESFSFRHYLVCDLVSLDPCCSELWFRRIGK